MQISGISFGVTDWSRIERTEHKGETGISYWQTQNFGDIRVRVVEYTPGYLADHWCSKGHMLLCLEGQLETELRDGRKFILAPGMSYHVADNAEPHRSSTSIGPDCSLLTKQQLLANEPRGSEPRPTRYLPDVSARPF